MTMNLSESHLARKTTYPNQYSPDLLFSVPRQNKRSELKIVAPLPFKGFDIWTAFELSWLNSKGKPIVAIADFIFCCASPYLIESKSLKLYLNAFNNTKFHSPEAVKATLKKDLSKASGKDVIVMLYPLTSLLQQPSLGELSGTCIDDHDIVCDQYMVDPTLLSCEEEGLDITETVYSHLLKSNCLMTGQPDWASVQISYTGKKINDKNLLKYIISFRNHTEFSEHCVERIFTDIMDRCTPKKLTVYARYTRRGGIDINPYRSTEDSGRIENTRLIRQ